MGLVGGVYMRKLALRRVSDREDFLISYRVHMMTGHFTVSRLYVGTLHVDKIRGAIQNGKHYACATRSSLPADSADRFHTETRVG